MLYNFYLLIRDVRKELRHNGCHWYLLLESSWNVMAHDAREGQWRGNWRMEWVVSTLHTTSERGVSSILPLMCTPRLPAVVWTDASAHLNGLVRFAERQNLVFAHVPPHFKQSIVVPPPPPPPLPPYCFYCLLPATLCRKPDTLFFTYKPCDICITHTESAHPYILELNAEREVQKTGI